jgi:hypothetical protein
MSSRVHPSKQMSKLVKTSVLIAATALVGALASSASAANWHTNGDLAFATTNGGAIRLIVHPAGGGSVVRFECPSLSMAGTWNGPTSPALPWTSAATSTLVPGSGSNCTVSGVPGYDFVCSSAELRANSYAGGDTLATAAGGVTTGALTGLDCRLSIGPSTCLTVAGSIATRYTNPSALATGSGSLRLTAAGQSLTASKIGAGCSWFPNGVATIGSPSGASGIVDMTFTVHGPGAPYIYRGT